MDTIAQPLLEVAGLHVRYGELVALRDVSLTVTEGEVVCIIGPNGAGKSTLLAAVAGGVSPDKGMIRFLVQKLVRGYVPDMSGEEFPTGEERMVYPSRLPAGYPDLQLGEA